MNSKDYFLRMLAYDRWANQECLTAMRDSGIAESKMIGLISHVVAAENLWLERLQGKPQSMAVWPGMKVEECTSLVDSVADAWREYLERLPQAEYGKEVGYRNSKGEPWSSRVEDVITHVFLHSAYHRGQIALQMRREGFEPALTDFIHAVRQGFVK